MSDLEKGRERLTAWLELFDVGERMSRSGIRSRLPPGGDEVAEYFRLVRKHSDEHQEAMLQFAREYARRVGNSRAKPDR